MINERREARHRDNLLRNLQNGIAWAVPAIIRFFDSCGYFPNTRIHQVIVENKTLQADDITLSQLEMTKHICKTIEQKKPFPHFQIKYILTSFLDVADGSVARRLKTNSREGAIKDAVIDRLSEIMIARLIERQVGLPQELSHRLQISFQLSTLTKAACEMANVKTSEGGLGSMIERRKILFFILNDLINLNKTPGIKDRKRIMLVNRIKKRVDFLINCGYTRARERTEAIESSSRLYGNQILSDFLSDENSSSASEACKYAGIVTVNNQIGINIVDKLNKLTSGTVEFPTVEKLNEKHCYIKETLNKIEEFIEEALKIAEFA